MRSTKIMRAAKTGYFIMSAVMCLLGFVMFFYPSLSAVTLCYLLGATLTVYGTIKIIGYFSKDLYRLAFQYDLAFGILLATVGIILLLYPQRAMTIFFIAFGVLVLSDGLFKIQMAMEAKNFGIHQWWLILLFAILAALSGLLLILSPAESAEFVMSVLGISLICDGILSFMVAFFMVKIIRYQQPDQIEVEGQEK